MPVAVSVTGSALVFKSRDLDAVVVLILTILVVFAKMSASSIRERERWLCFPIEGCAHGKLPHQNTLVFVKIMARYIEKIHNKDILCSDVTK